jgi:hypothetical protein
MRIDGEALTGLVIAFAVLATILYFLIGFLPECREDTNYAKERIDWPTTTVKAKLFDTSIKGSIKHGPSIIGHYHYEFGGIEHTITRYEPSSNRRGEVEKEAKALKAWGKTRDLTIQYNPHDHSEASDKVITEVPNCLWWLGGFILLFGVLMGLVLRGFYITFTR